jgi:hypothetical protein
LALLGLTALFLLAAPGALAEWSVPVLVETADTASPTGARVVGSADGDFTVVWIQSDGVRANLWSDTFLAAGGSIGPRIIESNDSGGVSDPNLAVGADGSVHAAWIQSDGINDNVWYAYLEPGVGWSSPVTVANSSIGQCSQPRIGVDDRDNVTIVYRQRDPQTSLFVTQFRPFVGWGPAVLLENLSNTVNTPDLAVARNGYALVVWQQSDGIRPSAFASRYSPLGTWENATLIEANDTYDAGEVQAMVDENGNGLATWVQVYGNYTSVMEARYYGTGSWVTARPVESDNARTASGLSLVGDGSGGAFALWSFSDGVRSNPVLSWSTPSLGWLDALPVETANDAVNNWALAVGADGHAVVIWQQLDGQRYNLWARAYTQSSGFGPAFIVGANGFSSADSGSVATDDAGGAFAVWRHTDGTLLNLWASRFRADIAGMPLSVTAPAEGLRTTNQTVAVQGSTLPGATVVVNGVRADVTSGGSFAVDLALFEGLNSIHVEAWDVRRVVAMVDLHVVYTDPRTFVEANLSATRSALASTDAELNGTNAELDATEAELSATQEELTTAHANLNLTKEDLEGTAESLAAAKRDLAATSQMALVGLIVAAAGVAVGLAGVVMTRRLGRGGGGGSGGGGGGGGGKPGPAPSTYPVITEAPLTYEEQLARSRSPPP